jgi:hypothetical protein
VDEPDEAPTEQDGEELLDRTEIELADGRRLILYSLPEE